MTKKEIVDRIKAIYDKNIFMQYCGLEIEDIECGKARIGLTIDPAKHMNLNNSIHGGLTATLADNALGVVGASVGKRVVTVSMQLAFIKGAGPGEHVVAEGELVSFEGQTMIIKVSIKSGDKLVLEALASMLVIADFEEIPAQW